MPVHGNQSGAAQLADLNPNRRAYICIMLDECDHIIHFRRLSVIIIITIIIIIICIQPLDRSGQRPEFSQATGMALVRCILGKFLGAACHCFPPLFRCSHVSLPGASTSATT